ncbi:hypothetical protein FKM82_014596 [Ascaphus truei]
MFQQVVPYRIPEELWAQAVFNNGTGGTTYCTGQEINDPGQEVPGHRLPGQEVPGHRHPGQEVPGQEVPGHRHPGQEVPGHRPAQEAQRPPPAKRSPATTTSTTPYTKGRFSVSRIDTPPHEAEHIFINQENGNRASQTPKKSRKSFLVSTLKKTQLRRSRKLEALEVMRSRRRSGATEANLFVKKSWADVVKFGVTQPQKQSHNPGRKAKMTKRRTKIKVLQTPAQKMKAQIRTGHADSPATIVIGRAHSRTVHLTGHIPKVVKNYALKLNLDQDESFTGMSELFNSPLSDKQRSSCLEGNQNDMTQNKSSIDQTSVLQTPEESGDMVVSPLNITSVTTERPYNRDAVSRLLRSPISTELHKGNDQILETVMQMGGITRPTTECKVKKIKTPPKKRETIDLTGIKRITPKQKGKPVTDPVALKRLLRTPRQMESLPVMYTRRSPQQVEDLVGIKRIMKTPKQKGEPVEDLVGIKRIMRTPKQKGESVEDLVGIKRIMRTPKQKGESVEDLVGIKEIMRTPRQEEEPVEDMVGIKHIMKTPKLKGRPVEDLMGISHIMRTPPRENTHPIEEIIGIKQLKKTPQKKSAPVKELDVMPLSETRTSKTLSTKTTYSRSTTSLGQLGSNHSISNELSQDNWLKEMQHLDASENNAKSTPARRSSKSLTRLSNSSTQGLVRPEVFPQDKTYRDSSVESFFAVNKTIPSRISQRQPTSMGETNKAEVQRLPGVGLKDVKSPTGRGRSSKSWTHSAEDLEESEARISDDLPQSNKLEASTEAQVQESVPVSSSETPTQSRRRGRPSKSLTRLSSSSAGDLEASVARISDELPQNNRPEASTAKAQVQESVPVSSSETPTPSRRRGRPSNSLTRLSSSSAGDLEASVARISNELPQNNQLEASTAVAEAQESVLVSSNETPTPSRRRGRPSKSLTRLSSSSAGGSKQPDPFTQEETGGDSNVRHPLVNKTPSRSAQRQLISMGDSTKTDVHSETEVQKLPSVALKEVQSPTRSGRSSTSLTRSAEDLEASDLRISDELPQNNRLEASTAKAAQVQASTPVSSSETPTPSRRRGRPSKSLTRLSSPRQLIRMGDSNKAEVHTETEVQKLPGVALKEVKSTSTGRGRSSKSLTRSAKEDLEESEARISDDLPQSNKLEASTEAQVQETVPVSSSETPTPSRRRGRPPKSRTHLSSSSAGGSEEPQSNVSTGLPKLNRLEDSNVKHSPPAGRPSNRKTMQSLKNLNNATQPLSKSTRQNLQCDVPAGAPEPTDKSIKISPVKRSRRRRINLEQITKELKVPPMLHPEAEPSECLVAAYCEIVKSDPARRKGRQLKSLEHLSASTDAATTAGEIQNASSASSVGEQLSLKRSVTRNKVEDTVEQSREETILQRSPKKHAVEIRVETEILTSHTALVVKSVRTKNTAKKRPVRKPSQISPAETKEFNVITESEETLLEDLSQTSNNTMEAMWKNNENVLVEEQTVKSPKHKATRSTRQHQKAMLTELTAEAPTKQLRGRRNKTTAQDRLHLNITLDKGDLVLHEDTAASTIVTKSVRRGRHARGSNTNSVTELIKKESANENLSALSRQDVVVHEHKRSTDGGPVTKTRRVRKKQNLEGNTNVDSMDQHDSADVASVDIKEIFTRSTCGKKDPPQAEALHTETGTRLKGRKPANVKNKLKAMDDSVQISTRQNIEKENSSIPKSVHWHPLLTNMETSENNLSKETVPNNENKISNRSIRSRGKNKLDMPEATIPAKRSRRGKIEENTEEGSLNQSDTGKSAEMSETDSSHSLVSIKESIKVTKRGRNKMETNQNTPLEQIITVSKGSLEGHTEKSKEDPERIASTMDFKETVNDKTINKRNIGKRNITLANPLPSSGGQRDLGVDSNMTIDENLRNRKLGRRRAVAKNLDGEKKEQDKVTEIPISNQRRGRRASSQTKVHDGSKSSEPFSKNKVSSILETKGTEAISTKSRLGLKRKIANAEVVAEIPKACEPLSYTIAKSSSISKSKTQNATSARGRRNIRNISTQNEEAAISPKENGKASKQSPAKNNKTEAASITTQKKRGKSKVDAVKSGKATQVVKTRASARTRK